MSPVNVHESYTAHISSKTPLGPAINAWQIYLEDQGKSIHTIKAFSHDMELLASYLPPDRPLGEINTSELNNFLQWMKSGRGVPCSPKTFARRITSIKAFFRWLHKYGVIAVDPSEKLIQKSVVSPLPTVLTPEEVDTVMNVADAHRHGNVPDARYYTLVSLLINTGIKKSECLALSPNHIDVSNEDGAILFVRYNSPQYRYKERKIPLPQDWIDAYHEYQNQYPISDQLFPWSPRRLEYLLEDLSQEAGLDKHLSFDMCRWTCALMDWEAGVEHNKIRQKLGISKIQWREVCMKLEKLSSDLNLS
jgi:site-specific recombinase XerD